jgi:hypothetical protein
MTIKPGNKYKLLEDNIYLWVHSVDDDLVFYSLYKEKNKKILLSTRFLLVGDLKILLAKNGYTEGKFQI